MSVDRLAILDPVVYGDAFDCAVTADEIWLYARVRIDRDEVDRALREDDVLRSLLCESGGYYALAHRRTLAQARPARIAEARRLERRAARVAFVLRLLPFVRAVALTGSAAAGNASPTADVDLLVVVSPARVGTAFVLLGPASRLLGRRLFCPNYYVGADALAAAPAEVYIAREVAQARVLVGDAGALLAANPWIHDVFPNLAAAAPNGTVRERRSVHAVERWGRRIAERRLRAHYREFGAEVPDEILDGLRAGRELRFHASGTVAAALVRYEARRAKVAARVAALEREAAPV